MLVNKLIGRSPRETRKCYLLVLFHGPSLCGRRIVDVNSKDVINGSNFDEFRYIKSETNPRTRTYASHLS